VKQWSRRDRTTSSSAKRDWFPSQYRPAAGELELYDGAANSAWGHIAGLSGGRFGPHSTIDDFFTFSRLLLRRGPAAGATVSTGRHAYNLTRVMNIIGIQPLLAVMRA
jgi:hypothetical protein